MEDIASQIEARFQSRQKQRRERNLSVKISIEERFQRAQAQRKSKKKPK